MSLVQPPACLQRPALIPEKILLGPGPSNMVSEVRDSLNAPLLGHLHTEFLEIMDDVKAGIKYAFQTENPLTFAVSGTGHAGMECALVNVLEKDDHLLVVEIGLWGARAAEMGRRMGAQVKNLTLDPGNAATPDQLREVSNIHIGSTLFQAVTAFSPTAVFVCHGESSSGVLQPLQHFGEICHASNALLIVDTVASLGAVEFEADALQVDVVYAASQKVLNAPPGLAPISFSQRAIDKIKSRATPVPSFYFDALLLGNYWGCFDEPRRYHHTAPISTVYALRSALALLCKEGLEASIKRHRENAAFFYAELDKLGLKLFVKEPTWRLPCLTTVCVPDGVDWKLVMDKLMKNGVEIAGGLGPTAGRIWRMGTFGANSSKANISRLCAELKTAIVH